MYQCITSGSQSYYQALIKEQLYVALGMNAAEGMSAEGRCQPLALQRQRQRAVLQQTNALCVPFRDTMQILCSQRKQGQSLGEKDTLKPRFKTV